MNGKILVTGGTGYIGSHTAVELMEAGYEVVIVDDLSNSHIEVLDGIREITGRRPDFERFDLCDREKTGEFFRQYAPLHAVIHFAARKTVPESVQKPLMYYENNLLSLINLLNAMIREGTGPFVFSSSCTVYGEPDQLPVTEASPVKRPASPYGNTKRISEEILQDTIDAGNPVRAISLRYFNPIGAHPSGLIGELPLGIPDNLVPFITQTAIGVRKELRIFGDNYDTPDGSAIRDYINVVDLSRAHVHAVQRLLEKKNREAYEVFNLGTGKGRSVFEIVRAFEKATGVQLNTRVVGRRPGDVEKVWADTSLANRELDWKAETPLEETLASAWKWEKHYRESHPG